MVLSRRHVYHYELTCFAMSSNGARLKLGSDARSTSGSTWFSPSGPLLQPQVKSIGRANPERMNQGGAPQSSNTVQFFPCKPKNHTA